MEDCRKSILVWFNLFAFTYQVKTVGPDGKESPCEHPHAPFITWPVQDDAILRIKDAIDSGGDVIADKSRDMGLSWLMCGIASWYWLFVPDSHSLFTSRVEDNVDKRGDPDSLFWKIDYIHGKLPPWMVGGDQSRILLDGDCRRALQITHPVNGNTISGQATTAHIGRGGRRTFVVFDEMAAIQQATAAWQSAADTTSCRIGVSTPLGPGTEFTAQRNHGLKTGRPLLITLGYWDHPEKGRGREWRIDTDGEVTGIADRGYWWTPWFQQEVDRRQDAQDIGQNILIDHTTSGDLFFNSTVVTSHLVKFARSPRRCEIDVAKNGLGKEAARFVDDPNGRWYVWFDGPRPPERSNFVGFADLSKGRGASNSVVSWMNVETGEIVAEFVDPIISTHDLAAEVATAGKMLFNGDYTMAFLGWESNGPGEDWHKDLAAHEYDFVYFQRAVGQKWERRAKVYGWRSERRTKRILLTRLRRALLLGDRPGGIVVRSRPGLAEVLEYRYFEDGSIGPSKTLRGGAMEDEPSGAREAHGDRVIAYAGVVLMRDEISKFIEEPEPDRRGTFGEFLDMEKTFREIEEGKWAR